MNEKKYVHKSKYFYGHEISPYGLQNKMVDYRTLASAFDAVLNNDIMSKTYDIGCWELVNGREYDDEDNQIEVFQWYIVSDSGARILEECTNEILYYNEELDMYLWGVTHFGTSWDYVLTDIEINFEDYGN